MKYILPQLFSNSYNCPHCCAIAKQDWWYKHWNNSQTPHPKENHPLRVGTCKHCNKATIWVQDKMYFSDS